MLLENPTSVAKGMACTSTDVRAVWFKPNPTIRSQNPLVRTASALVKERASAATDAAPALDEDTSVSPSGDSP